jgi:mycofactocin precursor
MAKEKTEVAGKEVPHNEEEEPQVLEEIVVEELSIDGVCGVY